MLAIRQHTCSQVAFTRGVCASKHETGLPSPQEDLLDDLELEAGNGRNGQY